MNKKQNPTRKVRCNLLEAQVYVRFPVCLIDGKPVKKYCELQEMPCSNGIFENYAQVDYPINAESVNSYADTADYKKNPDIVTQAVPRQNLGDISELQKVLANDMSALREMAQHNQDVLAKLEEYQAKQGQSIDENKQKDGVNDGE